MSSTLLAVESIRACARYGSGHAEAARAFLEGVALVPLDDAVLDEASRLEPLGLRSLDSLHLATALTVGEDIGVLVTYDQRLADAATERGLSVIQPA